MYLTTISTVVMSCSPLMPTTVSPVGQIQWLSSSGTVPEIVLAPP